MPQFFGGLVMIKIIIMSILFVFCQWALGGEFAVTPMIINIEGEKNQQIPFHFLFVQHELADPQ